MKHGYIVPAFAVLLGVLFHSQALSATGEGVGCRFLSRAGYGPAADHNGCRLVGSGTQDMRVGVTYV